MKCTLALSLVLAALAAGSAFADDVESWVLSQDGIGPATVGMKIDQLQKAIRETLAYDPVSNNGCSQLTNKHLGPMGLSFTLEAGYLTRVDVEFYGTDPRPRLFKTEAGIGLGSREEDLLKAYPGARIKPNPADPSWHTVIAENPEHTKGMVFETNGQTVKSIRMGNFRAISHLKQCD
jgi:hypothetical protein